MSIDEFVRHLEVHGADLDRWPEPLRAGARAAAATPEGAVELEAARSFEALLHEGLPAPPTLGLRARILAAVPPRVAPAWTTWLDVASWRRLATAAVAPLAIGFVLGFAWPDADDELEDAVSELAFSSVFEEELATADGAGRAAGEAMEGGLDEE